MPVETRHIAFNLAEIETSILEYHRWKKEFFAVHGIDRVEIRPGNDVSVLVKVHTDDSKSTTEPHEFGADILSTALVLFCINRKIPLPVEGKKALRAIKDGLVLMVYLGTVPVGERRKSAG